VPVLPEAPEDWTTLARSLLERELVVLSGEPTEVADAAAVDAVSCHAERAAENGGLSGLVSTAGLSAVASRVLALTLAVDVDRSLQRLVSNVAADIHQSQLDLDLLARLLGPGAGRELAPQSRLVSSGLLVVEPGPTYAQSRITVPRVVVDLVLGTVSRDLALDPRVEILAPAAAQHGRYRLALVHGADRVRRLQAAVDLLVPRVFVVAPPPADGEGWGALVRQATVLGAAIVMELDSPVDAVTRLTVETQDHLSWALCSTQPADLRSAPRRHAVEVAAGRPEVTEAEWEAVFPGQPLPSRRPTAEQLQAAGWSPSDIADDAEQTMRRVATGSLLKHATRIVPRVGWDDLVLPDGQERQLRSVVDRYRQRSRVHEDWGLSLYPSPGVVALFSGPSGTGKTTSAEVIAHELGMDMFRVDLSALVSKYIGETEKNLEEIFSAAHTGNYLLLFDEADSLFGSRSKVEDAKDRYANMEVSYLLQRLETYDGVVVLTSNFQGNIDQAFLRRIHVTVHFTVPSAEERERIWDRSLAAAPRHDLDLGFVATTFDLSGGSIRNAALTAAFTAAARSDGPDGITMVDLLRAVSTELTKLGRRVQDNQLGRWLDDVRDPATTTGATVRGGR
jgi:SpoVK/Ycf46/Vps4 family AAA+-type ATPase